MADYQLFQKNKLFQQPIETSIMVNLWPVSFKVYPL